MSSPSPLTESELRSSRRRPRRGGELGAVVMFGLAAAGILAFSHPRGQFARAPFAAYTRPSSSLAVVASRNAFGVSEEVRIRTAMPSGPVEFPLEVAGDPDSVGYRWIPVGQAVADTQRGRLPLIGPRLVAPPKAGFYRLAVSRAGVEEIIASPTLAVMVPFETKVKGWLNGYKIGTYLAEHLRQHPEHPEGFLEVGPGMLDLPVSRHLHLSDFITHDAQVDVWPKYVALDPRLLDKLELVIAKIASWHGGDTTAEMTLDVHSGFRTPAYNAHVARSANDSRHEYGDAADIAIDADHDGRITMKDERLVAKAVEEVELEHPDLVGGMGLYTSSLYRTPYVHIDARGTRKRWGG